MLDPAVSVNYTKNAMSKSNLAVSVGLVGKFGVSDGPVVAEALRGLVDAVEVCNVRQAAQAQ